MAFNEDALSGWASPRDCSDQLGSLQEYMHGDIAPVQRALLAASGKAQSWLRARWPDAWPFATPPSELRDAVAAIAVYNAFRGVGMETASLELLTQLRIEADRAERWLRDVGAGKADLLLPRPADSTYFNEYHIAPAPGGEFGFGEG
jgi:phage gp36-like protein